MTFNHVFKFQNSVSNGCHDLTMSSVNITDITTITVKDVNHCVIIHVASKSEPINLLKIFVFGNRWYI